jgi:hypothetical protein
MSRELVLSPTPAVFPARLFTPTPKAAKHVVEFFTTQISNEHTRKAYLFTLARILLRYGGRPNYVGSIR